MRESIIAQAHIMLFKAPFVNLTLFKMAALDKMAADYKSTFIRYTNFLDSIGLGFFEDSKGLLTRRNAKFFAFGLTFFPFATIQFSLVTKLRKDNFLEGAQAIPLSVMFLIDMVKVAIIISNRDKIRSLFVEIGELWPAESQRSAEQTDIMSRYLRRNNKLINLFFTFSMTDLFAYEIIPLVSSVISLLLGNVNFVLPFRVPESWVLDNFPLYLVVYVYEFVSTAPSQMCLYVPTDLVIVIFCSDLSLLFIVVQSDLRNAVKRDGKTNRLLYKSDQESYNKIKTAVKTHQQLLRIASDVSGIFGILLLMHIISSSVIICFFGFLSIAYGSAADKVSYILTVFNAIFMIFILAIAGQLLYDASSQVAEAAYDSLWFESDVKVRKIMLYIITRAQNPANLSALGFSNMTLRTFSKIMSSAWTYFNLLIRVFEDI